MASKRRLERKGVEAIFTAEREQRDAKFLIGLSGIIAGMALWLMVFLDFRFPILFGTSEIGSFLLTVLASYGLILVISGIGICTAFSRAAPISRNDSMDGKIEPEAEPTGLQNPQPSVQGPQGGILSAPNFRLGLISFILGCTAIALYSGLADEYQSNTDMQQWVRAYLPLGRYLLTWETALALSALFGILVTQFLPRRALAE